MFPDAADFARRFGMKIKTTYGSTEVSAPHRMDWDDPDWKTCGHLADELYEARIVDANDEEVPDGTVGEFVIRSREPWLLMSGYWRHPEWTEKAWSNLWLHSGDAMMRTSDGRYYFVDRMSDSIRRRGENISSLEVENEINLHADVLECAVFPVPSEHTEDEVMATVVPQPGRTLDPEALIDFLEPRMARFMVPRYIDIAESLPKDAHRKDQEGGPAPDGRHARDLRSRAPRVSLSSPETARRCTIMTFAPDDIARYHRDGYLVVPAFFSQSELAPILQAIDEDPGIGGRLATIHDGSETTQHDYLGWVRHGDDWLGTATRLARIVEGAEALIGEAVYHYHSKIVQKPAGRSGRVVWHQDFGGWYQDGCLKPDMLTCIVALTSATEESGCLHMLKGSHYMGRIDRIRDDHAYSNIHPLRASAMLERFEDVAIELEPGDGLFFHCNTVHASG